MRVFDFECDICGDVSENFITGKIPDIGLCPVCGGETKRIVSMSQTSPVDSSWISSVIDVVDKQSDAPHCREFVKHPTRDNYKIWMKGENLRPLEPGEKLPTVDKKARRERIKKQLLTKHRERNAIIV